MPVWFVLGVQSKARLIGVNCCGVDLPNVAHCDSGVAIGWWVGCTLELTACCCHRKAPTTIMIRSTGMPILNQRRVREFIRFLQWVFFDSLPAAASQKGILWGHPTPRHRAAALCTPIFFATCGSEIRKWRFPGHPGKGLGHSALLFFLLPLPASYRN